MYAPPIFLKKNGSRRAAARVRMSHAEQQKQQRAAMSYLSDSALVPVNARRAVGLGAGSRATASGKARATTSNGSDHRDSASSGASMSTATPASADGVAGLVGSEAASAVGATGGGGKAARAGKCGAAQKSSLPSVKPTQDPSKILQEHALADVDEVYGDQERALNTFNRLHPMLSVDGTSFKTIQLVANLVGESEIPTPDLEIVGKSHDDSMLRPPDVGVGERPCCLNDRCVCVWMARWRFGNDTNLAFVCREFLLPSQQQTFLDTGRLPPTTGKCLVCSRYYHTFLYRLARSDPSFDAGKTIPIQAYGNLIGHEEGRNLPTHASEVASADGYSPDVMLFADEHWGETAAARTRMGGFLWRPVVRFNTAHYKYIEDPHTRKPRILQVNVSTSDPLQDFSAPAPIPEVSLGSAE